MNETDFLHRLDRRAAQVSGVLETLLVDAPREDETLRPARLLEAMRHGTLNGGKRLRPFLFVESAALLGMKAEHAIHAACALECVHCYSLIHDDLPAMDDDDLRRGVATVHRQFDEASAILAGDALLTLAFDILSDPKTHHDAAIRSELVGMLARASGIGGMAGGQILDLEAETRLLSESETITLQSMKTGALFTFACEGGAVLGGASADERAALARFGGLLGKIFQLSDDILDVTQSTDKLGKQAAKDQGKGKATLVSLLGLERARAFSAALLEESLAALGGFGTKADLLREAARFATVRDH